MKILFSPSESKSLDLDLSKTGLKESDLSKEQRYILLKYRDYIKRSSSKELSKLFGLKKDRDIEFFREIDIFNSPAKKAITRYNGTAFEYLKYSSLTKEQQNFLDKNLIIFSNLFGAIFADFKIPNYKLKQGESIGEISPYEFYKDRYSDLLDQLLDGEFIIDLRAGFYLKYYKPKHHYITLKFIKNGKVISHWAKAYRGKIVNELSKYRPQSESDFQNINFKNLQISEIIKKRDSNEYIFTISKE